MREVLDALDCWRAEGRRAALARVVGVDGSAPRPPGATLAVSDGGALAGAVSGGCVEAAVVAEALEVATGDGRARLRSFSPDDGDPFAMGLTCGGILQVFVARVDWSVHEPLARALRIGEPVAVATVVEGPSPGQTVVVGRQGHLAGALRDPDLDAVVRRDALAALASGTTLMHRYGSHGQTRGSDVAVFVEFFGRPPRMVIVGAADFTAALAEVAATLGYRVTVCDPRPVFATPERFPAAHRVVVDWPDRHLRAVADDLGPADAVCVLSHDHKLDVPAIAGALRTSVGYIGAMGSRRTHGERLARLREAGFVEADLLRVFGPIGLDIGAGTPGETAVAICAEIIATRTRRPAPSLRDGVGPIH